jgi:hypothetical protein
MFSPTSAAADASLGIGAKSVHKLKQKKHTEKPEYSAIETKKMRYALQAVASRLMYDRTALKQHRVCGCSRNVASDGVVVYREVYGTNARFSNVMTCGSVWACPVCAAKVTEGRRKELQDGVTNWVKQGGTILLLSLTFPHELDMPLQELLGKFDPALKAFKNSRIYKNTFGTADKPGTYGRVGSVRSLEVTYGVNGWHPHTHDLVFVKSEGLENDQKTIDSLKQEWVKQLLKHGLGDNSKINDMLFRGLDIRGGDYAAQYVAKYGDEPKLYESWSAAREVTKQHSKISGGDSFTPFMLLKAAGDGDPYAQAAFREFVNCFNGKRMNTWSPGLRALVYLNEVDDEELAKEAEMKPEEEIVIRLDESQWKLVLQTDARSEVLERAAYYGEQGVLDLLEELEERPKHYAPYFKTHSRPDISRFYH